MAKIFDMARPKTGVTPVRNLRVPDDIWNIALKIARRKGETITSVITDALKRYIGRNQQFLEDDDAYHANRHQEPS